MECGGGCGGSGGSGGVSSGSADGGCTLTQGYWKNHAEAWPVSSLTIGGVTYTEAQLLTLFGTSPGGDASLILAHQLIAAMLNVASGAGQTQVGPVIAQAQAWMSANRGSNASLPYGIAAGSPAGQQATSLADQLDAYNNGHLGPPHCGDGGGSGGSGGEGGAGGSGGTGCGGSGGGGSGGTGGSGGSGIP